jgi:hypothetical protein
LRAHVSFGTDAGHGVLPLLLRFMMRKSGGDDKADVRRAARSGGMMRRQHRRLFRATDFVRVYTSPPMLWYIARQE